MKQFRSFIAINVSESVKSACEDVMHELRDVGGNVQWTEPGLLHLTLKFCGNIWEEDIFPIDRVIKKCIKDIGPFELQFTGLGSFDKGGKPRVVWVGVEDDSGSVTRLARRLDEMLPDVGIRQEAKLYVPHLTLGRVKSSQDLDGLVEKIAENADRDFGFCFVDRVVFFESILDRKGPTYVNLSTNKLKSVPGTFDEEE